MRQLFFERCLTGEKNSFAFVFQSGTRETITAELTRPPVVSPTLYREYFVSGQAAKWAEARWKAATAQHSKWTVAVANLHNGTSRHSHDAESIYSDKLARWSAELKAASAAYETAQAAQREAYAAMIDE